MDPLTALGLAGNVVQFVDFSSKLLCGAYEVYSSTSGATAETADLGVVIKDLQAVTRRLSPPSCKPRTDDEIALFGLFSNCRKLSDEILKVLNKLQSKNPHQKWASLRVAWASMRKKEQLVSMETRLNRYRSEILVRISIMMKEEQSSVRTALEKIAQRDDTSAEQTREELRKLKGDILQGVELLLQSYDRKNSQASSERPTKTLKDIRTALSSVAEATTTIAKEDWVLKKLRFDSMYSREDSIEDAHTETFKWLVQGPSENSKSIGIIGSDSELQEVQESGPDHDATQDLGAEKQGDGPKLVEHVDPGRDSQSASHSGPNKETSELGLREYARVSFIEWLRCRSGIFYISGKAGSGKSTLMKFLVKQRRTHNELTAWADGKKLVFAHFFFWNSGTDMQKSLEGLYRSILFETLRECPDLIPEVFPEMWKMASHSKDSISSHETFRFPEILAAFDSLIKSTGLFSSRKFCFFIDGLDEHAGDYWKMAKSLKTWTTSANIKICVSGRPYNEFEESFSYDPKLRLKLHELTRQDMEKFVNDEFEGDERFLRVQHDDARYLELRNRIVNLADGVFLWVRLATHSLLTGLGNHYSISELEEKLKTMPTGLNEFFRKIWDSIDHSDRVRAAQTFSVATCNLWDTTRLNMLTYSFMDDLGDNKDFADEIYSPGIRAITEIEIQERLARTRQRLIGRCKGLLEITDSHDENLVFKYQVDFLHRTVKEFLVQDDMQKELEVRAGNFDKWGTLCLVCLAQIKFFPTTLLSDNLGVNMDIVDDMVESALKAEAQDSKSRIRELETLYDILDAHRGVLSSHTEEAAGKSPRRIYWKGMHGLDRGLELENSGFSRTDFSLIHYAAYAGCFSFVSRKVSLAPKKDLSLLASAALGVANNSGSRGGVKLTEVLLDRGASPNEPLLGLLKDSEKDSENLIWTPWTLLLLGSITSVHKSEYSDRLFEVFELFLRNGADTTICLLGYLVKGVKKQLIVLSEPFYMTLDQLFQILAPTNAETIRELVRQKSHKSSQRWLNWMTVPFQRGQKAITPKIHIKPLQFEEVQDGHFEVTSVASITSLDKLTQSEIEFSARLESGEEDGITKLVKKNNLSIRVA